MRVRKLDANNDYSFGHQQADFYINVPAAPAQAAMTRLLLFYGEWFLDTSDGTKWLQNVLGYNTESTRDLEIKSRITGTPNILGFTGYSSAVPYGTRVLSASLTVNTLYGQIPAQLTGGGGQLPTVSVGALPLLVNSSGAVIVTGGGSSISL